MIGFNQLMNFGRYTPHRTYIFSNESHRMYILKMNQQEFFVVLVKIPTIVHSWPQHTLSTYKVENTTND